MAFPWAAAQRRSVEKAFEKHPSSTGRCGDAAKIVLKLARKHDAQARIRRVQPIEGFYVSPKKSTGSSRPWDVHDTTLAQAHYIDVLTGPDGTSESAYLEEHWQFPDDHEIVDLDEEP